MSFDFIAIGDVTADAFIRLKEASVNTDIRRHEKKLCVNFADKIPYESVYELYGVGNSPNASVCASRLGIGSALVSNIGKDENGKKCVASLEKNGVNCKYVSEEKGKKTNYHYALWFEDERTILVNHEIFNYKLPNIKTPKWAYISSLASNSYDYHLQIISYLRDHPEIKTVFQPGTFQIMLGVEKLKDLYARTDIFFCNVEESQRILDMPNGEIKTLLQKMHGLGPKIVCITNGPKGAYCHDGTTSWFMPIYPDPKPPLERTGCGDSFAATFTAAIALGKSVEEALMWAPVNPMSVVQYVGAQQGLLTKEKLEQLLKEAPADYKPVIIH
ncbi:MAG: hypothetical protein A3G52_03195 [Candidatus Taylorbacteria bacterium RIFCSPLOWO2_12_FULL_43_20]|uniref:Carbohydrate kinase PfkB domain-containing protein n=1 Tax=Candidatus Taylorbacteria bacterium RIFCSPLOWO2_12_FULL_43_20 TaxID=1802332 RepID=A0A1G2P373_9BACT|nr:MAG: hypothetical protein A2825_03650 [Candidatus Taylorbacteria bacterium RIFCSPHIGHO2_01_FULL_43_120]OHA22043.1 MAG: hypothetical protein A3B98_04035 [Candidatus Taylorbacteria bacterium RIFCSPHIGHO2_02_FULL_43_55]OHA30378.1 MAG: hypothetical protein A3E92_00740 [Candidatus Taylorbacteria bacterium RIFCSPHIGHO2_12_FULL_42_34]OHA31540.1 MAG: hypothetical protein A3B09_00755 [Candidatus Taylorbacteria bacterium RIFCSPLOWO2_01_FULL_43_83]OHA39748.1 MAG: hypothetical protein A3H58_04820 [Candi